MEHQARAATLADRSRAPSSSTTSATSAQNSRNISNNNSSSNNSTNMTPPVVPVELPPVNSPQRFPSQRPYKYGMVMLCLGALINWLGLAENYIEPVRYVGVACIVTGAMLIIAAMCCWMNSNTPTPPNFNPDGIHVIDITENGNTCVSKPPDYETIIQAPPSYDVAIKLNPASLIHQPTTNLQTSDTTVVSISEHNTPPPSYTETARVPTQS